MARIAALQHLRIPAECLNSMQSINRLKHMQAPLVAQIKPSFRRSGPSIGNITLANKVILAPMSGITDAPVRRLVAELGAGLVVSEMTASESLVSGDREARLRADRHGIGVHVVQLAGCDAG